MSNQHSVVKKLLVIAFFSFSVSLSVLLLPTVSLAARPAFDSAQKEFVLGNYDKVVTMLKGKGDVDSIILVSRARHILDDADDTALLALLAKEPNNEKALTAMAYIREETRHYGEAEQLIQRIFKVSHQNAQAIAVFALCKIRQGNEGAGLKVLADALKLGDKDPVVLELAEGAYDCILDSEHAEQMCDRLIALQPRNPNYWTIKGRFMERSGKEAKALECYSKAIAINPRFDFAYTSRARMYYESKQHLKVVQDASGALASRMTKGQTLDCLALRAGAYAALNKHTEAIADIKEYLKLTDAVHHYTADKTADKLDEAYLHLSLEYIALGKYTDAQDALNQLKKLKRRDSEVLEQEAMIQARQGHKEAAIKMYEKLIKDDGTYPNWVAALKKLKGK